MSEAKRDYPAVRGLSWHRTQYNSFFLPLDWHRFSWTDGYEGEIYGPDENDPQTAFAVNIKDLGTAITLDDLDILAEGFFESVQQLPECHIEMRDQFATSTLIELEAKYTFREQEAVCKRWVRVFFHESRQIVLAAQGATPEKYDYWLPWFFEAMMTAKIHNSLPELPG